MRNSTSYAGTFNYECADDMLNLAQLRDSVKVINKKLKSAGSNERFYVKLQGRGKKRFQRSFDYYNSKYGNISASRINRMVAQSIPLECAERVDAYIYRRV